MKKNEETCHPRLVLASGKSAELLDSRVNRLLGLPGVHIRRKTIAPQKSHRDHKNRWCEGPRYPVTCHSAPASPLDAASRAIQSFWAIGNRFQSSGRKQSAPWMPCRDRKSVV